MANRDIYVREFRRIEPIFTVYGSMANIKFAIQDWTVPEGATAKAYARDLGAAEYRMLDCAVAGSEINFAPFPGFFSPGENELQVEIRNAVGTYVIQTFTVKVFCDDSIKDGVGPIAVESVASAAQNALSAAEHIDSVSSSLLKPVTATALINKYCKNDTVKLAAKIAESCITTINFNQFADCPESGHLITQYSTNGIVQNLYGANYSVVYTRLLNMDHTIREDWWKPRKGHLLNKRIALCGDSICYGRGWNGNSTIPSSPTGYGHYLAWTERMQVSNLSKSGATLCQVGSPADYKDQIIRQLAAVNPDDVDYVIVEGGTNDADFPLGEYNDTFTADFHTSTFCGAMEYICYQLTTRFAGKKVGFVLVHKTKDHWRSDIADSRYHYAKRICEKWGVPVCDLNTQVPPFRMFADSGIASLQDISRTYTQIDSSHPNGDGVHPNRMCYETYYDPVIVDWLEHL